MTSGTLDSIPNALPEKVKSRGVAKRHGLPLEELPPKSPEQEAGEMKGKFQKGFGVKSVTKKPCGGCP